MPKGVKPPAAGRGRKAGSKGKRATVREACEAHNVNPFEYMALVVKGDLPCNVCRQRLKTRVAGSNHIAAHVRTCQSCKGDGWEKLSPDFRGRMAEALGRYLEPMLSAVDHKSSDGSMRPTWEVVLKTEPEPPKAEDS